MSFGLWRSSDTVGIYQESEEKVTLEAHTADGSVSLGGDLRSMTRLCRSSELWMASVASWSQRMS